MAGVVRAVCWQPVAPPLRGVTPVARAIEQSSTASRLMLGTMSEFATRLDARVESGQLDFPLWLDARELVRRIDRMLTRVMRKHAGSRR